MIGPTRDQMIEGIDNSELFVVFVTSEYQWKVDQPDFQENCKFEFQYTSRNLGNLKIIPVLMQTGMSEWTGFLQACLGYTFLLTFLLMILLSFKEELTIWRGRLAIYLRAGVE